MYVAQVHTMKQQFVRLAAGVKEPRLVKGNAVPRDIPGM
jgi:hypothetical protein